MKALLGGLAVVASLITAFGAATGNISIIVYAGSSAIGLWLVFFWWTSPP